MLIIVGSPWQALLAKSYILKENITDPQYVIEKSSPKSYAEIVKILNAEETAIRLIVEWGQLSVLSRAKSAIASAYIDFITESLKHEYFKKVETILVFSEQTVLFKIIYDLFGDRKIYIKSEDGILDYLPELKNHGLLKKIVGYLFLQSRVKYYVYKNYYHIFSKVIMSCRVEEVSAGRYFPLSVLKEEFLTVLKEAYPVNTAVDTFKDKDVLLLCQSLSEDKVVPLQEELRLYEKFIRRCNDLKLSVIIKPHPRSCAEKIEALSKLTSATVLFFEDYGIPAESMLLSGKFKEVVGIYSNTIIYANEFFGVRGISLLTPGMIDLLARKEKKRFTYIYAQLRKYFSDEYTVFE
ncbi:hypothetical protein HDF26_002071 [Pedobacter cryoconitis]|uniref:alpha-2,8-polysialyltransferase family protein n=1 Tax=Pedobacter cryoconitis TaxID=188932 RepID=UPI00161101A8|nr:alpha-2,8-polysialyltransferase family protein [Pedobacter cryoconitis]MBB6271614.1 hypothetical protein [Pedobacter cryoconitis]